MKNFEKVKEEWKVDYHGPFLKLCSLQQLKEIITTGEEKALEYVRKNQAHVISNGLYGHIIIEYLVREHDFDFSSRRFYIEAENAWGFCAFSSVTLYYDSERKKIEPFARILATLMNFRCDVPHSCIWDITRNKMNQLLDRKRFLNTLRHQLDCHSWTIRAMHPKFLKKARWLLLCLNRIGKEHSLHSRWTTGVDSGYWKDVKYVLLFHYYKVEKRVHPALVL